jgi:PTH1 family peptidyl-tRNA hydrolase
VLDKSAPDLAAAYPPNSVSDEVLWKAVAAALRMHEERLLTWLDRAPQTNEVRRAAAVIAGIWWALGQIADRPVTLSELGASAGLNLGLDRFSVARDGKVRGPNDAVVALTPEWRGGLPPDPRAIDVLDRAGSDISPLTGC